MKNNYCRIKYILIISALFSFVLINQSKSEEPNSKFQCFNNSIRVNPYVGHMKTFSKEPDNTGPFTVAEDFSARQTGLSIEWLHTFNNANFFMFGLGAALSKRSDYNWNRFLREYSNKIYSIFELAGENCQKQRISFTMQIGLMEGSITPTYVFYIGGGPVINLFKTIDRFYFSINPFFEYHASEHKDGFLYDCRYTCINPTPKFYKLNFQTFSFNLSFIIQYNLIN